MPLVGNTSRAPAMRELVWAKLSGKWLYHICIDRLRLVLFDGLMLQSFDLESAAGPCLHLTRLLQLASGK